MAESRAPHARSPGPGPGSGSRSSCDLRHRLQNTLHIAGSRPQGGGSRLGSGGSSRPAQGELPVPQPSLNLLYARSPFSYFFTIFEGAPGGTVRRAAVPKRGPGSISLYSHQLPN